MFQDTRQSEFSHISNKDDDDILKRKETFGCVPFSPNKLVFYSKLWALDYNTIVFDIINFNIYVFKNIRDTFEFFHISKKDDNTTMKRKETLGVFPSVLINESFIQSCEL